MVYRRARQKGEEFEVTKKLWRKRKNAREEKAFEPDKYFLLLFSFHRSPGKKAKLKNSRLRVIIHIREYFILDKTSATRMANLHRESGVIQIKEIKIVKYARQR